MAHTGHCLAEIQTNFMKAYVRSSVCIAQIEAMKYLDHRNKDVHYNARGQGKMFLKLKGQTVYIFLRKL